LRRIIWAACLLLALAPCGATRAQEARADFLSFISVNDIRGIAANGSKLWLATQGGAVSYDVSTGDERVFHRTRDGLLSDSVSAVAVGPDGRVWLSTDRAGISVYDPQSEQWEPFTSQLRQIPGNRINRIRFDRDSLFVSAQEGFALFVGDAEPVFYLDGVSLGLPSPDVFDFVADPHGDGFWLSTAGGVVHRDSLEAYTVYPSGQQVPGRLVRYRGRWVTSFGIGVSALDPQSGTWGLIAGGYPGEAITDLMTDGDNLYLCTTAGPWKFDGTSYSRLG
jgi:hypothetical protein